MGPSQGLSDGRAGVRQGALGARQADGSWPGRPQTGPRRTPPLDLRSALLLQRPVLADRPFSFPPDGRVRTTKIRISRRRRIFRLPVIRDALFSESSRFQGVVKESEYGGDYGGSGD